MPGRSGSHLTREGGKEDESVTRQLTSLATELAGAELGSAN